MLLKIKSLHIHVLLFVSFKEPIAQGCGAKLFFSALAPAPAPTFKKFQLRLQQQPWNYLYHRFYVKKDIFHVFHERKST